MYRLSEPTRTPWEVRLNHSILNLRDNPTNWNRETIDWTRSKQLFKSHIDAIRNHPFLQSAWIVSVIERNTGHESGHLSECLSEYSRTYPLYQHALPASKRSDTPRENPGIWTDRTMKGNYAKAIIDSMGEGTLRYMNGFICANPFKTEERATADTKNEIHAQMARARWVTNSRTVDTGVPVASWSGKTGADGKISGGANDDLLVTLGMTMYWMKRILQMNYPSVDYKKLWA